MRTAPEICVEGAERVEAALLADQGTLWAAVAVKALVASRMSSAPVRPRPSSPEISRPNSRVRACFDSASLRALRVTAPRLEVGEVEVAPMRSGGCGWSKGRNGVDVRKTAMLATEGAERRRAAQASGQGAPWGRWGPPAPLVIAPSARERDERSSWSAAGASPAGAGVAGHPEAKRLEKANKKSRAMPIFPLDRPSPPPPNLGGAGPLARSLKCNPCPPPRRARSACAFDPLGATLKMRKTHAGFRRRYESEHAGRLLISARCRREATPALLATLGDAARAAPQCEQTPFAGVAGCERGRRVPVFGQLMERLPPRPCAESRETSQSRQAPPPLGADATPIGAGCGGGADIGGKLAVRRATRAATAGPEGQGSPRDRVCRGYCHGAPRTGNSGGLHCRRPTGKAGRRRFPRAGEMQSPEGSFLKALRIARCWPARALSPSACRAG